MVNPEEDLGSFWEQYNGQPVQQPQVNDLVYRNELEGIPPEQLENNRPYYYTPEDQKSSEGALKLLQLAANTQPQTANDAGPQWDIDRAKQGITNIESGGNYLAQGPLVKYKDGTEDRAYGKYQVMGRNIPVWTKQVLGVALTPEQFLQSKEAQEKVFEHKFGENVKRYGNVADAASVWFAGKPIAQAGNRSDVLGTTVPNYVAKFLSAYNGAPQRETPVEGGSNARGSVAATIEAHPDQKTLADVKAAVTKSRAPDFAAIVKALAGQGGGSPMINQAMQANQQQAMAARRKMASEVAKYDEERVASLAEALKRGTVKGYASGGKAIQYFEEGGEADSGNDNGSNNDSVGTNSDVSGKGQESGPGIGDNDSFGGMADVASQNANEASLSNSSFGFSGTASPTSNVGTALGNTDFGAFGTNLSGVTATDFSGTTASPFGGVATDPSATPGYGGMSTANVGSLATGDVGAVGTAFGGGPASPSNNTDTDTDKSDSISNPTMADVNAIESLAKELASLNQNYGADSSSNELYKTKFADGGLVTDNGQTPDGTGGQQYDAYGNLTEAQGGPIHAIEYNPDHINAIAQQIQEGTYA